MFLRELLVEDRVKDLDKVLKPYLKNNHTSRDWAAIILLTGSPNLFQLKHLFDGYSSALKDLSSDEIYKIIDHYIDTYPQARSAITKGKFKASNFPYKERTINSLFQSGFPTATELKREHQFNKENDLWDPVKLRDTSSRRGSLGKPNTQTTPTSNEPTDAEPFGGTYKPTTPTPTYGTSEASLLKDLYNHAQRADGWEMSFIRRTEDSVVQLISLIIAASSQDGLAAMQQMRQHYWQVVDKNYGKKKINYPAILEILKRYRNVEKTNPVLKAWEDLPNDVKNTAWQKYKIHLKYGFDLEDTGAHPGLGRSRERYVVDPDTLPKLPRPGAPRDVAEKSLEQQMLKYDTEDYVDDIEEILGERVKGYWKKLSPEKISAYLANVSVVAVDYDVFDWNMRLLAKNKFVDPINNLDDPILQLGIMGDPRNIESTLKASPGLPEKYPERKVIARWPGMGIWGAAYGGPYGEDTLLSGEDQLMAYHPSRAARTDAHEIRHRAFNIISLLPALRNKLPADLKPGGKWWGSYGDEKYTDWDKIEIATGAWAEHALIYAVDYAAGTTPERRMKFFDNGIFNTKDYPISYWKKLYYDTSKVVGDFLKEIGADKRFIKPKPLNYYNRPPLPGDNIEISNSMAPYIKTNPGWTEMYRHILLNDDLDQLQKIEAALDGDMFMGGWNLRRAVDKNLLDRFDVIYEEALRAMYNAHFSRAYKFALPIAIKKSETLLANWKKRNNKTVEPEYIRTRINELKNTVEELGKLKDIEILLPGYFAKKVKAGEIEPATNAELRRLLPYSIGDYRDHKAQIELGAIPLPGVEPKSKDSISSSDWATDYLRPDPNIEKELKIPNHVYGNTVGDSDLVQYAATSDVIAYLLGYIKRIHENIPWPANYDMDATIQYYNDGGEKRRYTRKPGVPYPITGQIATQLKAAYEAAQNGTEPTYTGPNTKIPTSEEPPLSPEPEPVQDPDVEPTNEPDYDDEFDTPIDEPNEPIDEPDDDDDVSYSADELEPIPYYIAPGIQIDRLDSPLVFKTTDAFLSRLSSGAPSPIYDLYSDSIQWPGDYDIDKAINFYNHYISKNPGDYRSRDLPKRINDELRQELRQKYAKLKRKGTAT